VDLKNAPRVTARRYAEMLGLSESAARRQLEALVKRGEAEVAGRVGDYAGNALHYSRVYVLKV